MRHEEDRVALARAFYALDRARRARNTADAASTPHARMRRIDGVLLPDRLVGRVRAQLEVAEVPLAQRRLGLDVRIDRIGNDLGGLERAAEIGREDGNGSFSHNRFERVARRRQPAPARSRGGCAVDRAPLSMRLMMMPAHLFALDQPCLNA